MIICSCNVLTHAQIVATLESQDAAHPLSPGRAYRCLGCAPRCGRCVETVRALLVAAHVANCEVGCPICPANEAGGVAIAEAEPMRLIAAE